MSLDPAASPWPGVIASVAVLPVDRGHRGATRLRRLSGSAASGLAVLRADCRRGSGAGSHQPCGLRSTRGSRRVAGAAGSIGAGGGRRAARQRATGTASRSHDCVARGVHAGHRRICTDLCEPDARVWRCPWVALRAGPHDGARYVSAGDPVRVDAARATTTGLICLRPASSARRAPLPGRPSTPWRPYWWSHLSWESRGSRMT